MIEETELEFDAKHRADCTIKIRLWQRSLVKAVDQGLLKDIVFEIVKLHVDPGPNRHACGVLGSSGNFVYVIQALDSSKVREDEALETPLPAENRLQQERICG